jgi:nitrogen fixation-related uncharacterized protein
VVVVNMALALGAVAPLWLLWAMLGGELFRRGIRVNEW